MRSPFTNPIRSLSGRLALAVASAVAIALLLLTGLSTWREVERYAAAKREALRMTAQILAASAAQATAQGDEAAALSTLRAIAHGQALVYASVERADGEILAEQGIGLRLSDDIDLDRGSVSPLDLMTTRTLRVSVPILENARPIGRVVLVSDNRDLAERIAEVGLTAVLAGLLALALGLAVSMGLQRSVTRPLAALARTMDGVRLGHDYSKRAEAGSGEVGALAESFNDLLRAVNERDRAIARYNAGLEEEIRLRTHDLIEAKQSADEANAAKSVFLATMSHEIRTPMNGMLVMAELLASADLPPRQQRYARVIARSGQSLLAIINDILDFAKVEAGRLEVERIPLSPRDVADTVVTLFAERAASAGLDLAAQIDGDVPRTLLGDPVRLGQVLGNFVSNALKFTAAGHVLVRMAMEREASGPVLRIAVSDTGIGIPQDRLAGIFTAFTQADQSIARRFGGTGLGLSIAERLIVAMGGRVGVESRLGEGSTFWARIPVEGAESAGPTVRRASAVPAAIRFGAVGAATRAALTADLRAAGFRPAPSGDGHWILEASELRESGRPEGAGRVVALVPIGDGSGPGLVRDGLADAVLRRPLAQAEWRPLLAALAEGAPLAVEAPEVDESPAAALPSFAGARVLLADDSAVNREVAAEALGRFGVRDIVCVEDGQAAVEAAAANRFDLVLMDGSMPVLDGFSAAAAIRAREARDGAERVPIVALTAHVVGDGAESWQAAGMDGLLAKPFTLAQLGALLARHLPGVIRDDPAEAVPPSMPIPAMSEVALLDEPTIANLEELGDRDFLERILHLYVAQAPQALLALEDALARDDAPDVARAAHGLKSMSANIGAAQVKDRAGAIERAARDGNLASLADGASGLDDLLARTVSALHLRLGLRAERGPDETARGQGALERC
ncbi:ATPase domain-containing protein [Methylorubrum populi]|uniref:histidine kinase n=1 Tax=Methylorubrum populi TaxID=223967 RepID=A0A160PIW2_9HYPH|nr:hybrid sensor histidine kinase/response regulator [Methylorubrum populi]BAU92403.1 ATPase domain-containing protein [Methylorubrum populi]